MIIVVLTTRNGGWYWRVKRKGRITVTSEGNDGGNGFANKANAQRSFFAHADHLAGGRIDRSRVEFVVE